MSMRDIVLPSSSLNRFLYHRSAISLSSTFLTLPIHRYVIACSCIYLSRAFTFVCFYFASWTSYFSQSGSLAL